MLIAGIKHEKNSRPLPTDTRCPQCQIRVFFLFNRDRKWLTVYFIPIWLYYLSEYISCPVCRYTLTLNDSEAEAAREDNFRLDDGEGDPMRLPAVARQSIAG